MLAGATPEQQDQILHGMTVERLACLDAEFEHWAHKNQLPPNGEGWSTWLMMAGRGLPTANIACEPGAILALPLVPKHWQVQTVAIEAFVTIVELRPVSAASSVLVADAGRIAVNPDEVAGPITLALLDIPNPNAVAREPVVLIAASSPGQGWKSQAVDLEIGGQHQMIRTASAKSVLGHSLAALGDGTPYLLDEENSVEIQLIDHDQWLVSCDADALAAGSNAAILGQELIQFGRAEPLGTGRWRLSGLLRGRAGTEWACGTHAPNEIFCLLDANAVQSVSLPQTSIGGTQSAVIGGAETTAPFQGEALRPLAPTRLSADLQDGGDVVLSWTRRSRAGFAWIDGVDAPLGESRELYRIALTSSARSIEISTNEPTARIDAAALADLGPRPIDISVQQIGDYAASRPAEITLI